MLTFSSRKYARKPQAVGRTEKAVGVFILCLLAGIVSTFVWQVATNEDHVFNVPQAAYEANEETREAAPAQADAAEHAMPFPSPGIAGWRLPSNVARYSPQSLYTKINGRAEAYLRFHVVGLTFGTYTHQNDHDRAVDVYWYDMGEPVNALGAHRSEAPPDADPIPVGQDAYQVGGAVFFRQGASYVQVLPASQREDDAQVAMTIAQRLAEWINDGPHIQRRKTHE